MTLKTFAKTVSGDRVADQNLDQLGKLHNIHAQVLNGHTTTLNTQTSLLAGNLTFGSNLNAELLTVSVTTPTSPWTSMVLANSWAATSSTPRYRKDQNGVVWLEGRIHNGTTATSQITTLPAGYTPGNQILVAVRGPGVWSSLSIDGSGNVAPVENSANTDFSMYCSFTCSDLSPGVLSCFPLLLAPKKVTKPVGVIVANITDTSVTPTVPAIGTPTITINTHGQLFLTNLPGLLLGRTYSVTLLLVGG